MHREHAAHNVQGMLQRHVWVLSRCVLSASQDGLCSPAPQGVRYGGSRHWSRSRLRQPVQVLRRLQIHINYLSRRLSSYLAVGTVSQLHLGEHRPDGAEYFYPTR